MESAIQQVTAALFHTTDWNTIPVCERKGESGHCSQQTLEYKGFRVRIVEYSGNYRADHWCKTGHIVYCLEGEMTSELDDGRQFQLSKGMSYVVANDVSRHRSYSKNGVKLLIIDGPFLDTKNGFPRNPWKM
jgi:mannose-6-phosphate isomerase class I